MDELLTYVLLLSSAIEVLIFSLAVSFILQKERRWLRCFLIWIGILLSETVCFTLLPSQAGIVVSLFNEDTKIILEDGALIRNFGQMLLINAVGIFFRVVEYLIESIMKRERPNARFLLVEAIICSICYYLGNQCIDSDYVIYFESGDSTGKTLLAAFGFIGLTCLLLGAREFFSFVFGLQKNSSAQQQVPSPSQLSPEEALARFDEIVAEKNRLIEKGDYESQIPLLTEGTGLNLDVTRKARIWNYMGLAYRETDSADRALECFQTALQIDPDHPSSYMNIAMHYSDRKEYDAALKNAEIAIEKAKQRGMSLGVFYADYAQITGLSGNLRKAKQYLRLAEKAGYDNNSIQKIQKQLGIRSLKFLPF